MAGALGFEPSLTVLETAVLPLTPRPHKLKYQSQNINSKTCPELVEGLQLNSKTKFQIAIIPQIYGFKNNSKFLEVLQL